MAIDELFETARRRGFNSIEEFVRGNIHYLSEERKEIFNRISLLSSRYNKQESYYKRY